MTNGAKSLALNIQNVFTSKSFAAQKYSSLILPVGMVTNPDSCCHSRLISYFFIFMLPFTI